MAYSSRNLGKLARKEGNVPFNLLFSKCLQYMKKEIVSGLLKPT
jgi:hypothetical protein